MKNLRLHGGSLRAGLVSLAILIVLTGAVSAQQTVGLFKNDSSVDPGYLLFSSSGSTETYLIDTYGRVVHSWTAAYAPGVSVYLLENGNLLRPARSTTAGYGGKGGRVEILDWDSNLLWGYDFYVPDEYLQHHDVEPLPNGNILVLLWEIHSIDSALAHGRDPSVLPVLGDIWSERIIEVEPVGTDSANIVWSWSLWDHMIQDYDNTKEDYGNVAAHPELVDVNFNTRPSSGDWIHANAIEYNEELDQIVLSSRFFSEVWIIDHSTTTAEAASHTGGNSGRGGDLLYRWGNPQTYRAGDSTDEQLWGQHDAQWIKDGLPGAGRIILFNNGVDGRGYTTIDEIELPLNGSGTYDFPAPGQAFGPAAPAWTYPSVPDSSFYATFISGQQRLPNGHTLICDGPAGRFFEIDSTEQIVWDYVNPSDTLGPLNQGETAFFGSVFRCWRYSPDYPAFDGKDLSPGNSLEIYPITIAATGHTPMMPTDADPLMITTEITSVDGLTVTELVVDTGTGEFSLPLVDDGMHGDGVAGDNVYGASLPALSAGLVARYYVHAENSAPSIVMDPPNPPSTWYFISVAQPPCCIATRGDVNGDGIDLDPVDLSCLVDNLFGSGCPSPCAEESDVNGDGLSGDPVDLSFAVDYLFNNGIGPSSCP